MLQLHFYPDFFHQLPRFSNAQKENNPHLCIFGEPSSGGFQGSSLAFGFGSWFNHNYWADQSVGGGGGSWQGNGGAVYTFQGLAAKLFLAGIQKMWGGGGSGTTEEVVVNNVAEEGPLSTEPNEQVIDEDKDKKKVKMKSADEYDYSQDVIPGKMQDDLDYIKNGEDGNMVTRWWETLKRDWNAKDNVVAQDIRELTELGINVLPVRLLRAGPAKLTQYESVIDISKFTKPVKGSSNMVDPKSGYYLSPTKGNPHGHDAVYKLFDSKGNRIGTFDSNGKYLRP